MRLVIKDINTGNVKNQSVQKKENVKYGFWGVVTEVDSITNTVDVKMGGGLVLKNIPVACTDEWICEYKDDGYVAGARNLPPRNARVFVMMPTGTYESAFVLCSGLSMYEDVHKKAFMAGAKNEKYDKDKSRQIIRQGKWESLYNYEKASYELKSPNGDEGIILKLNDDKDKKEVNIKAFGSAITIDKDGNIKIEGNKDTTIEVKGDADVKVKGDVNIDGNVINLNGKASSSVKAEELQKQLNIMKLRIDGIINAIKTSAVVAQDGGATYKVNMTAIVSTLANEDFSNIIDAKVKHGS